MLSRADGRHQAQEQQGRCHLGEPRPVWGHVDLLVWPWMTASHTPASSWGRSVLPPDGWVRPTPPLPTGRWAPSPHQAPKAGAE